MPHHVVLNYSVLKRCLGTHSSDGTRVLSAQPVLGYSVLGNTLVLGWYAGSPRGTE